MPQALTPPADLTPDPDTVDSAPACVMSFNASDPSGAGGLTADIMAIASAGGHALAVVTGAYSRDTAEILDHFAFDDDAVSEQARAALEDMPVSAIAEIASDYADAPLVAYMPSLSWWEEDQIDSYLDAFRELLLPQTTLLIGNHSTLWRWLLPDWSGDKSPSARDIAKAAGELGVPFTLVTGIPAAEQFIENVLATPQSVLYSEKFEHFDASFAGAGDTLSAALSALLANGHDMQSATTEALTYLDHSLNAGFQPGMGHLVPDRMFWAQADDDADETDDASSPTDPLISTPSFDVPPNGTKH